MKSSRRGSRGRTESHLGSVGFLFQVSDTNRIDFELIPSALCEERATDLVVLYLCEDPPSVILQKEYRNHKRAACMRKALPLKPRGGHVDDHIFMLYTPGTICYASSAPGVESEGGECQLDGDRGFRHRLQ